jgi:hypothetical protein
MDRIFRILYEVQLVSYHTARNKPVGLALNFEPKAVEITPRGRIGVSLSKYFIPKLHRLWNKIKNCSKERKKQPDVIQMESF